MECNEEPVAVCAVSQPSKRHTASCVEQLLNGSDAAGWQRTYGVIPWDLCNRTFALSIANGYLDLTNNNLQGTQVPISSCMNISTACDDFRNFVVAGNPNFKCAGGCGLPPCG